MVNSAEIRGRIIAKGLTQQEVAKMLGITPKTFGAKLKAGILNSNEITELIKILDIKDPLYIFFGIEVS